MCIRDSFYSQANVRYNMLLIISPLKAQNSQPLCSVFLLTNKAQVSLTFNEKLIHKTIVESIIKYRLEIYFSKIFGFKKRKVSNRVKYSEQAEYFLLLHRPHGYPKSKYFPKIFSNKNLLYFQNKKIFIT